MFAKYWPTEDELTTIKQSSAALLKESNKEELVGQIMQWRCVETKANYLIVKTSDKRPKIAILPKCLISSFGITLPIADSTFSFDGLVIEQLQGLPVIAVKPELERDMKIRTKESLETANSSVGYICKTSDTLGVTVRFFNGVTVQVAVKDLQLTQSISDYYKLG